MTEALAQFQKELERHIEATEKGHYGGPGLQPKDLLESIGVAEDFYIGNAIKYVARYKRTHKAVDLLKAAHYVQLVFALNVSEGGTLK